MQEMSQPLFSPRPPERPLPALETSARDDAIDTLKGIGIVLVVVGHLWKAAAPMIFWFHMPLFFMISGFLYRRPGTLGGFYSHKVQRLLVPYVSFLPLLWAPTLWKFATVWRSYPMQYWLAGLHTELGRLVWGGRVLRDALGTTWFVPCLVITQVLYASCERRLSAFKLAAAMAFFYGLALADAAWLIHFPFPLNADVALFAVLFVYAGQRLAELRLAESGLALTLCTLVAVLTLVVHHEQPKLLHVDLKEARYGTAGLSVVVAFAWSLLAFRLASALARFRLLARVFGRIGQASLVIMFVHPLLREFLHRYPSTKSAGVCIAAGILVPLALHALLMRTRVTRRLFLGMVGP